MKQVLRVEDDYGIHSNCRALGNHAKNSEVVLQMHRPGRHIKYILSTFLFHLALGH